MSTTLRFAPGVGDLRSLGDLTAEAWMSADPEQLGPRATLIGERAGARHLRLPLPGTPDARGERLEPPRDAGTGWLHLHRYDGGGLRALTARLTVPRSTSLAARHWNLICHLRAHGLGAPELVALGERRGAAGVTASFLITRELDGCTPLDRLAEEGLDERDRRRTARALGLALRGLFRAGVWLPELRPGDVLVRRGAVGEGEDCAALELEHLRRDARLLSNLGLRRARLPAVAFANLRRGRVLERVGPARRARLLAQLDRALPGVSARERRIVLALATRAGAQR